MFALHPCEMRTFIEEILAASQDVYEKDKEGKENEQGRLGKDLTWLKTCIMVCGSVVDMRDM